MQYRKFGKLDWQVSALGFGCMRLPTTGSHSEIDEPAAMQMVQAAVDQGVNYLDTAYPYHGGNSEPFVGRFLEVGDNRARVKVASKLPCWVIHSPEDFDKVLNEQLAKLQSDHIDFYMLHGLERKRWDTMRGLGVLPWAEKAIADGRIGCLGFSFHDDYDAFQDIVDGYDKWTFCQIQYNYMDIENQAGRRGLQYAASKGLGVIVMEPVLGGRLVNPPEPVKQLWESNEKKRPAADWAFQWLWDQPEVALVLSGMSSMDQVNENLASASISGVHVLTESEQKLVMQVRDLYKSLVPIDCTNCKYCLPCPNGVNIPRVFQSYNDGSIYDKPDWARNEYTHWIPEAENANNCLACSDCEAVCPQSLPVSQWMPVVHAVLAEGKEYVHSL
jgi:uncharacterized protein